LRDAVAPVTARLEIFGVARLLTSVSVVFLLLGATTLSMALALQTERRGGEIAVRCALGATSGRIASMLAVEVGVVVLLATLLAFPLAAIALEAAGILSLPGNLDVGSLDLRLGALAARAIVFSGSFVGLAAFLLTRASAARLAGAHPAHGGIAGPGVAPGWLRRGFVVVLLAVTVCLLGSGTFFTQTLQRSLSIDLGYQADRLLNVDFNLVDHAYTPVVSKTSA
jgi:hypothetical protein